MIGQTISHYTILEKLGEGGMGVVYKAKDNNLRRIVALKFLPYDLTRDSEVKKRFLQEAQAASALEHQNICNVHEVGETEDGQIFIVMACYEGETLSKKIQDPGCTVREAIDIAIQIVQGLAKAHEHGIIHRDIKPANIIITTDGGAKILDFGLAKLAGQLKLTKTSSTLGTVYYMSPEQARGDEVGRGTDIWSVGVVLYEMLTGRLPFQADYEQAVIYKILNEKPLPIGTLRKDLPEVLEQIITRALAKDPRDRYHQMGELLAELKALSRQLQAGTVRQPKPRYQVVLSVTLGAFLLIGIAIGIRFLIFPRPEPAGPITSIAVLPFQNLSADPEQEYFSDGMTEALITELSKIKALRVISRTSVMRYKKTVKSLPEIAQELKVDAVIEGSVQRSMGAVRINAQLVKAEPEQHLWARPFTRNSANILELQSEIAQAIAAEIKIAVTPEEKKRLASLRLVNPEAHEEYLRGMFRVYKSSTADILKGIDDLERAISLDSTYAPAYAGIGIAYDFLASYENLAPKEAWPKVRLFAQKALELDETLPEAYMLIGDTKYTYEWDFKGAEEYFKRAIELNPNYSMARSYYAGYLISQGRFDEAIRESRLGRSLDPLSATSNWMVALYYLYAGLYDSALTYVNETLKIDSTHSFANNLLSYIYASKGMFKEAIAHEQKVFSRGDSTALPTLGFIYALSGEREKALEVLGKLGEYSEGKYVPTFPLISIYCALGDTVRIFECLDRAYEERSSAMVFLKGFQFCDYLLRYPRYHAMLKKVGLEQ